MDNVQAIQVRHSAYMDQLDADDDDDDSKRLGQMYASSLDVLMLYGLAVVDQNHHEVSS